MSISHLLNETCTIIKRRPSGSVDEYGNPVIVPETVSGVKMHMQEVSETIGQNGAFYSAKLYLNAGTDILADDCVQARNRKYWVNSALNHVSPIGTPMPFMTVLLRETEERKVNSNA